MSRQPQWDGDESRNFEIPLEDRRQGGGRSFGGFHHWHAGPPRWPPHPPSHRARGYPQRYPRRRMFARFAGALIMLVALGAGIITLASHIWGNVNVEHQAAPYFYWWRICGLVVVLPMLIFWVSSRAFRSFAVPLADIMEAASEVASGNLQVRVKESGSREFQQLATSFNRMTEELARTDQLRRNLTADVAHELRTPLHIIQGNLEGILDGVYSATPEHIEATLQETRTLARLVDDLRTLSLAESGQLPLHLELVDVQDLLADVCTSFSPLAESAGVDLAVEMDEATPLTLYGDAGRLDQVLNNLVGNALRHTPTDGRVTLGASLLQNGAGRAVQLVVADTGEGIAADDLPFIFDRFWRGDRARTHKEGTGSGLGLAITAQLVKAHGGTISVSSEVGNGTTFTLTLPVVGPNDEASEAKTVKV